MVIYGRKYSSKAMSENQIVNGDGSCQQNNIEKVENVVVEPKSFNNYHNSVVINLTLNVTGDISDAEISRIIETVTASINSEIKDIISPNSAGEWKMVRSTFSFVSFCRHSCHKDHTFCQVLLSKEKKLYFKGKVSTTSLQVNYIA